MTKIKFEPGLIRMPSGRFRNKTMEEIPSGYLYWIAANFDDDVIASAADEEYRRRSDESNHWEDEEYTKMEDKKWWED